MSVHITLNRRETVSFFAENQSMPSNVLLFLLVPSLDVFDSLIRS